MAGYFESMGSALGLNADQTQGTIGAGFGAAGLGLDIMGILGQQKAAKEEYQTSIEEAQTEMKMNEVRRQMMTVDTNRKMIQASRDAERARSQGKAAAANQGALQGSGDAGGQAQATAQGAFNTQGLAQSFVLGTNMFDLTNQLDQEKIRMAQEQSSAATSQGWAQIGGAVLGQAGNFAKMAMLF